MKLILYHVLNIRHHDFLPGNSKLTTDITIDHINKDELFTKNHPEGIPYAVLMNIGIYIQRNWSAREIVDKQQTLN